MNSFPSYSDLNTYDIEEHSGTVGKLEVGFHQGQKYWIKQIPDSEVDANLASSTVSSYSSLEAPQTSFDAAEEVIIIEDLGNISLPYNDVIKSNVENQSIFGSVATKTLLGDRDMDKNIAYLEDKGSYQAFDMDNAGSPISYTFETGVRKIQDLINWSPGIEATGQDQIRQSFARYISRVAEKADIESMRQELEGNEHRETILNNFETAAHYEHGSVEDPRFHFSELWSQSEDAEVIT